MAVAMGPGGSSGPSVGAIEALLQSRNQPPQPQPERPPSALGGLDSGSISPGAPVSPWQVGPLTYQRYSQSDIVSPGSWGTERVADLQRQLMSLGLLKPGSFQLGWWDFQSQDAYAEVLDYANMYSVTAESALRAMSEAVGRYGQSAAAKAKVSPLIIEITNPDQIKSMAQELAVRFLNRPLGDDEASRFATVYNDMEREYQRQHYQMMMAHRDATEPMEAGEIARPPSISDYGKRVAKEISESDVKASSAVATADAADAFFSLLRSTRVG